MKAGAVWVVRMGMYNICALPCTDFESEVRAEEVMREKREAHWELCKGIYRDWDHYLSEHSWWVGKVPMAL
jgi:hypothetical protein